MRLANLVSTKPGSAAAEHLHRAVSSVPDGSHLVIVGAHHFADDANDPLRAVVGERAWGGALLVEASPPIAHELQRSIHERNPLPRVPSNKVIVSNVGIRDNIPKGRRNVTRPFFTFTGTGGGLPSWSTQVGTFNHARLRARFQYFEMSTRGNWTWQAMQAKVVRSEVACRSLVDELRSHSALAPPRPAVMLIDVEGLDCRVVAAQDWCAEPLSHIQLLVFEYKHCTDQALRAAQRSLARCPWHGPSYTKGSVRVEHGPMFANRENVFYMRGGADRRAGANWAMVPNREVR